MTRSNRSYSSFLTSLPVELRLQIYDYCLADVTAITITAAPLTVFGHTIKDKSQPTITGLPEGYCPLLRDCYDPALLSLVDPPTIPLDGASAANPTRRPQIPYLASLALLQTCRLIKEELGDYMRRRRPDMDTGGLALYVSYPYGIIVLKELCPFLIRQAKRVYISGHHLPKETGCAHSELQQHPRSRHHPHDMQQRPRLRLSPRPISPPPSRIPSLSPSTLTHTTPTLSKLVRTLLPPTPAPNFQTLEARIFYPGGSSYSRVWTDASPIVQILQNTCGGKIDMEVHRGSRGTVVVLKESPSPKSRHVSTVWRNLRGTVEGSEGFVIGERWGKQS